MEVGLHAFEHQVHIFIVFSSVDLVELNDVLVLELPQEHDLSVGTLGVSRVLKGIEYLLEG
jgi:hypothetical protein